MKLERKTFDFELKEQDQDKEFYYIKGWLSTFGNVDLGEDVVVKGAFSESLIKRPEFPILWHHNSLNDYPPLGMQRGFEKEEGLWIEGKMPLSDSFVRDRIIPQLKIGSISKMSIGYVIHNYSKDTEYRDGIRYLLKVDLYEGSLVIFPMNEEASLKTISYGPKLKLAPYDTTWDQVKAHERVKRFLGVSGISINSKHLQEGYSKCFIEHDKKHPMSFGAYKHLITDVVDGELMIIPKSILSAAAKIRISNDHGSKIGAIDDLYGKIGLNSPFVNGFRIDDITAHGDDELKALFISGVCFSEKAFEQLMKFGNLGDKIKLNKCDLDKIFDAIKHIKEGV